MNFANSPENVSSLPEPNPDAMAKIPGPRGWPIVGSTLEILADPKGVVERFSRNYGPVYRTYTFGVHAVTLLGPEANEFLLLDQAKVFSSAHGWGAILGRLFPRGLMLLDFDEHRLHRKALSVAFKSGPMKSYLEVLNNGFSEAIERWCKAPSDFRFYPAIKDATLDLASVSFLGRGIGDDFGRIKQAYIHMIAASVSVARHPFPGTQMYRGVKGRAYMIDYFRTRVPARRAGEGSDLFSQLCRATTESGALLTPQEIADHMNFLMLAAHDTLASALTSFVYFLAKDKNWQEALRDEMRAFGLAKGEPLPYERLQDMPLTEMAFNESLRLIPPVPSVLRCAIRDVEFGGFVIPGGTCVNINPLYTHHMPEYWPNPERFDPLRFSDEAIRSRHKYAFVPFGGGAHMCLGLNFAYMQAKCFAFQLLSSVAVSIDDAYTPQWSYWPIPRPRDGLRVRFTTIH